MANYTYSIGMLTKSCIICLTSAAILVKRDQPRVLGGGLMSTLRMLAQSWRLSNPLFVKLLIAAPLLVAVVAVVAGADTLPLATQWPMGGRGLSDRRNQPFTLIGVSNVKRLKTKWVFTTGGSVSATPAVVNGAVYFPDWPPV